MASELGFDDAATIQTLISTVVEQSERLQVQSAQMTVQSEQMKVLLAGHANFKTNFEVAVELRMRDQHASHVMAIEEMEERQERRETAHGEELQTKEAKLQLELQAIIQQFNDRDQAQHAAKLAADEQQRLRDEETNNARAEERSAYEEKVDRLAKKSDDAFLILSEMRQIMAAAAQSSASTQQMPQQMVAHTPTRRPTTTQQSLQSRVNVDIEMEDTSQLTNTLSGAQGQDQTQNSCTEGVFSPPRIEKKRQPSEPAESRSTEETQGTTHASIASLGTSNKQQSYWPSEGLATQLDHDECNTKAASMAAESMQQDGEGQDYPFFTGTTLAAEALTKSTPPSQPTTTIQDQRDGEAGRPSMQRDCEDEAPPLCLPVRPLRRKLSQIFQSQHRKAS
jgi:hypothetical protein